MKDRGPIEGYEGPLGARCFLHLSFGVTERWQGYQPEDRRLRRHTHSHTPPPQGSASFGPVTLFPIHTSALTHTLTYTQTLVSP
jgi:hypothetical protein